MTLDDETFKGADFKGEPRKKDKGATRKAVLAQRSCVICGEPTTNAHHLVPRSQGGDDVPENLVSLDGSGTTGCHGKIEAHDKPTRSALRSVLTPEQIAYIVEKKSRAWLDRYYPVGKRL